MNFFQNESNQKGDGNNDQNCWKTKQEYLEFFHLY